VTGPGGSASATTTVVVSQPSINLSGLWQGTWRSNQGVGGSVSLSITHSGSSLSGLISFGNSPCFSNGTISGGFSGTTLIFTFVFPGNPATVSSSGYYTASSMSGTYATRGGLCDGDTGSYSLTKVN
jgi:hypothetical protein